MNFKNKEIKISLFILIFMLLLSSCSGDIIYDENGRPIGNRNMEVTPSIDGRSLREAKSIYKDDKDESVITMYLTVSKGNAVDGTDHTWTDVNTHSASFYQENGIPRYAVEGMLQVGDETGPLSGEFGFGEFAPNSIVQIRGQSSSRSAQKSYKIAIKSNEGFWRGQTNLAINKHVYDTVRFRNKLSFDLLKTIPGAFSTRTQFVHLYVKDLTENNKNAKFVDYGLYTQAEQLNKKYLQARGLDENGQLYKAIQFNFERHPDEIKLIDDPEYNFDKFESIIETKGSDNHSKMITMLDELNDYSIPIEEVFEKYFDQENYFTWLAFHLISGNKDTASQNFFLYSPQNGNKWYFMSWDNDSAWRHEQNSVFKDDKGYNFTYGVTNYWGSVLHKRVLTSPEYRNKLDDKINEILPLLSEKIIREKVAKYDPIVKPYLFSMPDLMYTTNTVSEYEQILEMLPKEAALNHESYKVSLRKPMPFRIYDPEISGEEIVFKWEEAIDLNGEALKYTFELSGDYNFANPVFAATDLYSSNVSCPVLPAGQYFQRVTVVNESGETQTAMEIYRAVNDLKYYGVKCFYVGLDGAVRGVVNE